MKKFKDFKKDFDLNEIRNLLFSSESNLKTIKQSDLTIASKDYKNFHFEKINGTLRKLKDKIDDVEDNLFNNPKYEKIMIDICNVEYNVEMNETNQDIYLVRLINFDMDFNIGDSHKEYGFMSCSTDIDFLLKQNHIDNATIFFIKFPKDIYYLKYPNDFESEVLIRRKIKIKFIKELNINCDIPIIYCEAHPFGNY